MSFFTDPINLIVFFFDIRSYLFRLFFFDFFIDKIRQNQPANAGIANKIQSQMIGGSAVTANTEPAINTVPRIPISSARIVAKLVLEFSRETISCISASKCLCSLVNSTLFTIFRFRFSFRTTESPLFCGGKFPSCFHPKFS